MFFLSFSFLAFSLDKAENQPAFLVKDINTLMNINPSSIPANFVEVELNRKNFLYGPICLKAKS